MSSYAYKNDSGPAVMPRRPRQTANKEAELLKEFFQAKESDEQKVVAEYLNQRGIFWIHVVNEGRRHPGYTAELKRRGLRPGCPDIIILEAPPLHESARGVMIEMKRAKGGVVSENQVKFFEDAEPIGWLCKVCFGADEALEYLRSIGW